MPILYHGTDSVSAKNIIEKGFEKNSCLTSDVNLAWYYTEARIEDLIDEGVCVKAIDKVVVCVVLPPEKLVVDYASYEEPISIFRDEYADNDRDWHSGCDDGTVPYPKNKFDVAPALKATTSVRTKSWVCGSLFS